jgi:hypothetical protein
LPAGNRRTIHRRSLEKNALATKTLFALPILQVPTETLRNSLGSVRQRIFRTLFPLEFGEPPVATLIESVYSLRDTLNSFGTVLSFPVQCLDKDIVGDDLGIYSLADRSQMQFGDFVRGKTDCNSHSNAIVPAFTVR